MNIYDYVSGLRGFLHMNVSR